MDRSPKRQIIGAAGRACERSISKVAAEMREGLDTLAILARIAPWLGIFGTVISIPGAFQGCGGERSTCMAATVASLGVAIYPLAFGLLAGLFSLWCFRYLDSRVEEFRGEMDCARLELMNRLRTCSATGGAGIGGAFLSRRSVGEAAREEAVCRWLSLCAGSAFAAAWLVQAASYFVVVSLPLAAVMRSACCSVAFLALLTFLPAHFFWVTFLHRRPGALAATWSALCAACCVAGVWTP